MADSTRRVQMVHLSIDIPDTYRMQIDHYAAALGLSRSELVRELLKGALANLDDVGRRERDR